MKNMIQTLRGVKISFQQPVHFFIKTTWLLLLMWLITIPNLSKAQITYGVFDPGKGSLSKVENQNLPGGDYKRIELTSVQTCQVCIDSCLNDPKCAAYTYVKPGVQSQNGVCWLKSSVPTPVTDPNCISGIKTITDKISDPDISYHENIDIPGNNLRYIDLKPGETCQTCIDACLNDINCIAYTYTKPGFQAPNGRCYLKSVASDMVENKNCISGIKSNILLGKIIPMSWLPNEYPDIRGGIDLPGNDYKSFIIPYSYDQLPYICQKACYEDPKCKAWTYITPGTKQGNCAVCYLKDDIPLMKKDDYCISGVRSSSTRTFSQNFSSHFLLTQDEKTKFNNIDKLWTSQVSTAIGDINQKNKELNAINFEKQKKIYQDLALPSKSYSTFPITVKNPEYSTSLDGKFKTAVFKGKSIINGNIDPKLKLPVITSIDAIVTDKTQQALIKEKLNDKDNGRYSVYEARYIIIHGANFGKPNTSCGVNVQFEEIRIDDPVGTPVYRKYDLIPYNNNWEISWYDDFIIAKVPIIKEVPQQGRAYLSIWRDVNSSFVLNEPIDILSPEANPSMMTILPPYQEGHIAVGSVIFIYGSGFGYKPGALTINTSQGKVYTLPCDKTWSQESITAIVPDDFPFELLDEIEDATLNIKTVENQDNPYSMYIKIGPRTTDIWMNPYPNYAFIDRPEGVDNWSEKSDASGAFALVTHYPGCDAWIFSEGETGYDKYFENKKLPPHFKLSGFYFQAMNPHTWEADLEFGLEQLANLALNPVGFVSEWLGMALASLWDPGVGKYEITLMKQPTPENLTTQVHFHNTCSGAMDGVPNHYMIGYRVHGPVKYIDQLE